MAVPLEFGKSYLIPDDIVARMSKIIMRASIRHRTIGWWFAACRNLKDAEAVYTALLRVHGPASSSWKAINRAFLARWSASSLDKVKREAWRRCKRASR